MVTFINPFEQHCNNIFNTFIEALCVAKINGVLRVRTSLWTCSRHLFTRKPLNVRSSRWCPLVCQDIAVHPDISPRSGPQAVLALLAPRTGNYYPGVATFWFLTKRAPDSHRETRRSISKACPFSILASTVCSKTFIKLTRRHHQCCNEKHF